MEIANHRSRATDSGEIMSSISPRARIPTRIDDHGKLGQRETWVMMMFFTISKDRNRNGEHVLYGRDARNGSLLAILFKRRSGMSRQRNVSQELENALMRVVNGLRACGTNVCTLVVRRRVKRKPPTNHNGGTCLTGPSGAIVCRTLYVACSFRRYNDIAWRVQESNQHPKLAVQRRDLN